jgi:hypothetical protein
MSNFVKLEQIHINDKFINISGSSTSFVNTQNHLNICTVSLLEKISLVGKLAKAKSVKLFGKNKTFQNVRDNIVKYEVEYSLFSSKYQTLKTLSQNIVDKGIQRPTLDNQELNELSKIQNEMRTMFHNSTSLSIIRNIEHRVNYMIDSLKSKSSESITFLSF